MPISLPDRHYCQVVPFISYWPFSGYGEHSFIFFPPVPEVPSSVLPPAICMSPVRLIIYWQMEYECAQFALSKDIKDHVRHNFLEHNMTSWLWILWLYEVRKTWNPPHFVTDTQVLDVPQRSPVEHQQLYVPLYFWPLKDWFGLSHNN